MDFLHDYLLPSLKICFISMIKWVFVITVIIVEYLIVLTASWGLLLLPIFMAIDIAILRAYGNYQEDKERIENGWLPRNRGK